MNECEMLMAIPAFSKSTFFRKSMQNLALPYSAMTSREKSALLSAPQTDQRLRSLLLRRLLPRISSELLLLMSEPSPSSDFLMSSSSSIACSSASGESSMVSRELIDGDRERIDVGVLGMLEAEL